MDKKTYEESNLRFTFNEEWVVRPYDDHRFYQGLSGVGLKGVDFIGIYRNERVVFFEVKNYRIRNDLQPPATIQDFPDKLADAIAQKVEDTFTAIDAVQQYYRRRWTYRAFFPLIRRLYDLDREWVFWSRLYELIQQRENCQMVLWLALDEPAPDFRMELSRKISAHLPAYVSEVNVAGGTQPVYNDSLRVE